MTVFDTALATLHADPNMGTDAEWQAASGGDWIPLRVIQSAPSDAVPGLPGAGAKAVAKHVSVRRADLPQQPARNDLVRWGSPAVTYRVETVAPDTLGLACTLGLVTT